MLSRKRLLIISASVAVVLMAASVLLLAVSNRSAGITRIWTDKPEFITYAEQFNASQNTHRVVIEYRQNPAEALIAAKSMPDIVIGPWLKGERSRTKLIPVDYLFNELSISAKLFYRPLLDLGNIQGHQYLLPVSFNLPAIIFSPENQSFIRDDFTISLDAIRETATEFNTQKNGIYTRMGFSPRWNSEFLYLTARLFDARFEEGSPLFIWQQHALDSALTYLRTWTVESNTSTRAEDDFQFKYLYDPPYKLVTGGRSLFSYMNSEDLFILPPDKLQNIDFRWIRKDNSTPITENITYLGICKKSKNLESAEAFLVWFFSEKTQKELLERSRTMGVMDHSFGIAGGFSSLKPVNEKVFPLFYPSLFGHLPPAEMLTVPRILPNAWLTYKKDIVIPWLQEATAAPEDRIKSVPSLESRISGWLKTH